MDGMILILLLDSQEVAGCSVRELGQEISFSLNFIAFTTEKTSSETCTLEIDLLLNIKSHL